MILLDTSYLLSLCFPVDPNHQPAVQAASTVDDRKLWTTQGNLSEMYTVGAQRFNKTITIDFIHDLIEGGVMVVYESPKLTKKTLEIFTRVTSKNVSWVDCLVVAVAETHKIGTIFTFDTDFKTLTKQIQVSLPLL
jgi:predicted nucleic acid-binding protein